MKRILGRRDELLWVLVEFIETLEMMMVVIDDNGDWMIWWLLNEV